MHAARSCLLFAWEPQRRHNHDLVGIQRGPRNSVSGDNETKEALNRGGVSPMFQRWVAQALGVVDSELTIHAIAGDASPRRYFRVTRNVGSSNALAYRPEGASDEFIAVDALIAAVSPLSEITARSGGAVASRTIRFIRAKAICK